MDVEMTRAVPEKAPARILGDLEATADVTREAEARSCAGKEFAGGADPEFKDDPCADRAATPRVAGFFRGGEQARDMGRSERDRATGLPSSHRPTDLHSQNDFL
jgi:hypothetical protein